MTTTSATSQRVGRPGREPDDFRLSAFRPAVLAQQGSRRIQIADDLRRIPGQRDQGVRQVGGPQYGRHLREHAVCRKYLITDARYGSAEAFAKSDRSLAVIEIDIERDRHQADICSPLSHPDPAISKSTRDRFVRRVPVRRQTVRPRGRRWKAWRCASPLRIRHRHAAIGLM
jgi:hypothetical protein